MKRVDVPWEYVAPKGDGTDVPNEPCAVGAALGEQLARLADLEEARRRERFPSKVPPKRCNDCAFRVGTIPNQSLATVANALKSAAEVQPFFCHQDLDTAGEATRLCRGYVLLAGAPGEVSHG